MKAMGGGFPTKETDFIRLCQVSELYVRDMLHLLEVDYAEIMSDNTIYHIVHQFLCESDICYKSYEKVRKLFDSVVKDNLDVQQVTDQALRLSYDTIGRDIIKKEIGIVDGHDSSSYFWINPVRIIDLSDTNGIDNVAEMTSVEISIEEADVDQYLTPFLYKYFDENLEPNKFRVGEQWEDEDGTEQTSYVTGFEWYLTHNFYSYEAVEQMLEDIKDTIDALSSSRETEYTKKLREKRGWDSHELVYSKDLTPEQVKEYNANRPKVDDTEAEIIIDFYHRFIYRMEYQIKVGKEKGYTYISFMGP